MQRHLSLLGLTFLGATLAWPTLAAAQAEGTLTREPASIAVGSVSTLTLTLTNSGTTPVSGVDTTLALPAGVTVAPFADARHDCTQSTLTVGADTVAIAGGRLGVGQSCRLRFDVTSAAAAVYSISSGDILSSAGTSPGPATTLTVASGVPTAQLSVSPNPLDFDGPATLSLTLENPTGGNVFNVFASIALPPGVAREPFGALNHDCTGTVQGADDGFSAFNLFLPPASLCTVQLPIRLLTAEDRGIRTSSITSTAGTTGPVSTLIDAVPLERLNLTGRSGGPIQPGGNGTLEFTLFNRNREEAATDLTFTLDLGVVLPGAVATGLPVSDVCGTGSTLSGASIVTFSGGSQPAGGECRWSLPIAVPAGAATGTYSFTTSSLTGTLAGTAVTGSTATFEQAVEDVIEVGAVFAQNPVAAGASVVLDLTFNNDGAEALAPLGWIFDIQDFAAFVVLGSSGTCNAFPAGTVSRREAPYSISSLAAGASCTQSFEIEIDAATPPGTRRLGVRRIEGTTSAGIRYGYPLDLALEVLAGPVLSLEVTPTRAVPGDTVTLSYRLANPTEGLAATAVAFSHGIDGDLLGAVLGTLPTAPCGAASTLSGTDTLTLSGGALAPGESCTFSVPVNLSSALPVGSYPLGVNDLNSTVGGSTVQGPPATATLDVLGLSLSVSAVPEVQTPDGSIVLDYTITNLSSTEDVTNLQLSQQLETQSLATYGAPPTEPCGTGSLLQLANPRLAVLSGGNLLAGESCSFSLEVVLDAASPTRTYLVPITSFFYQVGSDVFLGPATQVRFTVADPLSLTRSFDAEAIAPGDTFSANYVIGNADSSTDATALSLTDALDTVLPGVLATGIPVSDPCGGGSSASGTDPLVLSDGNVAPGSTCTFEVELTAPDTLGSAPTLSFSTSVLSGTLGGNPVSAPASTATLAIHPLRVSQTWEPSPRGATTTVRYTLENRDATVDWEGIRLAHALADDLPGASILSVSDATACGADAEADTTGGLRVSRVALEAGASCTLDVTLALPADLSLGTFATTSSPLTVEGAALSSSSTGTLEVLPAPVGYSVSLAPTSVEIDESAAVILSLSNDEPAEVTGITASTPLPANLAVSEVTTSTGCMAGTAAVNGGTLELQALTVSATTSCVITLTVSAATAGDYVFTPTGLDSDSGPTAAPPPVTLTVTEPMDSSNDNGNVNDNTNDNDNGNGNGNGNDGDGGQNGGGSQGEDSDSGGCDCTSGSPVPWAMLAVWMLRRRRRQAR